MKKISVLMTCFNRVNTTLACLEHLLAHRNIVVQASSEFKVNASRLAIGKNVLRNVPVYYSGPIDALFDNKFGALPWRTLRFEIERLPVADAQGASVINYAEPSVPYTRVHEFKHYHPKPMGPLSQTKSIASGDETIIMREYFEKWRPGDEPYYPVNTPMSSALLLKYQSEARKIPGLVVGGRLGQYKYFDMDWAIESALNLEI